MPPTDEESAGERPRTLVVLATAHIRDGILPGVGSSSVLAGPGRGECCALCGERIGASSVTYEVTVTRQDGAVDRLFFHIPCYNAWKLACQHASE
jgi:hypothetical protein